MYNNIDFNNKTILITGGAGFIGSNLAFYLQDHFPASEIIIFDCYRNEKTFLNGGEKKPAVTSGYSEVRRFLILSNVS